MSDLRPGSAGPGPGELTDLRLRDFAPVPSIRRPLTSVPRPAEPVVDMHNHVGRWLSGDGSWLAPDVDALLADLDDVGVATLVNLDGRWGAELAENLDRYDAAHPARFATFCHLDWSLLRADRPTEALVRSLTGSAAAGARGVKVWKDLGLQVTDSAGQQVLPDDERLTDVFLAAGELGLPVLIHTADPVAFFAPLDRHNERLDELGEMPAWWFGGPEHPTFDRLMAALETVVARAPGTTFVGAHVGCAAEDLDWVRRMLLTYPNFNVDLGGRLGELGRQPRRFAALVADHPDRVLFGTDSFPPDPAVYRTYYQFLETADECFPYAPGCEVPPQGRWEISGAALPVEHLTAVYGGNARRILG